MKILTADYLVTVSDQTLINGGVVVNQDKILDVGNRDDLIENYPDAHERNFGNSVLMPGLVNSHSHLELTVLRGFLDKYDDDFASWLITLTKTRANLLTDDDLKTSALLGATEGLRSGVTTFADIGRFGEAGFEALKSTGLRGILFQETEFSPDNKTADKYFNNLVEKFFRLMENESALVRVGISPHSPYTVSRRLFEKIAEFSLKDDIPITIHASESADEELLMKRGEGFFSEIYKKENVSWEVPNSSSIEYLKRIGVLETKPLLAHCVKVSESDIDLIADSETRIAHCPKSNAKFGHGIAPFSSFMDRGIRVGLGSDSMASNNACDLFEEARFAALVSRVRDGERFIHSEEIIKAATIGGASALGMEDRIGTLEIGKQADIIAISLDNFSQTPAYDLFSALAFTTSARDVVFTMVAGKQLYDRGEFETVDEDELIRQVKRIAIKIK